MTNCELWCPRKKSKMSELPETERSFRLKSSLDVWFVRFEHCSRQARCRWKLQFVIAQDCNCISQISDVIFLELSRLQIHNLWEQCSKLLHIARKKSTVDHPEILYVVQTNLENRFAKKQKIKVRSGGTKGYQGRTLSWSKFFNFHAFLSKTFAK